MKREKILRAVGVWWGALAPLTLEKAYAKTMSCVKDALSTVELLRGLTAEARAAQMEMLKAYLNRLQMIAAEKKLVTVADEADVADDVNLGL